MSFERADAEDLPFDDAAFELVTCRIAPHHFPDVPRFLRECARVLTPGGSLMLQDHVLPADDASARFVDAFERLRDPSHHRGYNESEWRAMLTEAGLRLEYSEFYVKRHDFLPWVRRQGNDAATVARLITLLREAPAIARDWMDPRLWGEPKATFVNRHILVRARAR